MHTTKEEREQSIADMSDAQAGKLVNYDIEFGFARRLITDIEIKDKRLAAIWEYLNVLVRGKSYIKNDSQERYSWSEIAEWFDEDGEAK